MSLDQHIKDRVEHIADLSKLFGDYFQHIEQFLVGANDDLVRNIKSGLKKDYKSILSMSRKTPSDINKVFTEIRVGDAAVSLFDDVISVRHYFDRATTDMSDLFIKNLKNQRDSFRRLKAESDKLAAKDTSMFKTLKVSPAESLKLLSETNDMTLWLLENIIVNGGEKEQKAAIQHIEKIRQTEFDLPERTLLPADKSKYANIIAGKLCREGFLPITPLLTEEELKAKLDPKISLIRIRKINKSPLYFNIHPLIDKPYIEERNMMSGEMSGLTKKVVERFDNIQALSIETTDAPSYEFEDKHTDQCHVVETLDGKHWRCLSQTESLKSPTSACMKLIQTDDMMVERLNQYAEEQFMSTALNPNWATEEAEYNAAKAIAMDITPIKTQIMDILLQEYDAKKIAKSNDEYRKRVIDRDLIADAISTAMFDKYSIDTTDTEIALSFIKTVDMAISRFFKEINGIFNDFAINDRLYKELEEKDLWRQLRDNYRNILKKSVDAVDSQPSLWKAADMSQKEFILRRKTKS